ncbi:uncharacterized protein [Nicotiana sylvestris]|uniref:uncharacterized protein n=1 Tax=Nicotiana sylvestris TaxID=4096 RepID=UPI00388C5DBB
MCDIFVNIPVTLEAQYQQILGLLSNKDSPSDTPTEANNAGKIVALSSNVQVSNEKSDSWIVDSGATHHISSILDLMSDVSKVTDKGRDKVTLPNGGCVKIEHVGSSYLSAVDKLKNVLHVPGSLQWQGEGDWQGNEGLYVLKEKGIKQLAAHVSVKVSTGDTGDLWHKRLGHASIPFKNENIIFLKQFFCMVKTNRKSPFAMLHGKEASIAHLRVFGYLCYATNLVIEDKFAATARRDVHMGYSTTQKGYRLYDLNTKYFFVSRDVSFGESEFPFKAVQQHSLTQDNLEASFLQTDFPTSKDVIPAVSGSE